MLLVVIKGQLQSPHHALVTYSHISEKFKIRKNLTIKTKYVTPPDNMAEMVLKNICTAGDKDDSPMK